MKSPNELYQATQTLFRAFNYLSPRMRGGGLFPPTPMNPEALAGCILYGCMAKLVRELHERRDYMDSVVNFPLEFTPSTTGR